MPKFDILLCAFPYRNSECPSVGRWLGELKVKLRQDARIDRILSADFDDTPITMTRNLAIETAKQQKVDLVLFVDDDMKPDGYMDRPMAKPFWDSSFDFMLNHQGPCIVAAPYCGPPPEENVYIFKITKKQSGNPNVDVAFSMFPREEAASRSGFEEVIALPTGLMLIDMRAIEKMKPPYFDYEWADPPFNTRKASTEDVYFTRNAALAGIKVFCNWYSWAGHWKYKCVGPPIVATPDMIREEYREAVAKNNLMSNQSLLMVKSTLPKPVEQVNGNPTPSWAPRNASEE
jgi:hypothetical protein